MVSATITADNALHLRKVATLDGKAESLEASPEGGQLAYNLSMRPSTDGSSATLLTPTNPKQDSPLRRLLAVASKSGGMNDIQFNRTGEYVAYAAQNTVSVWTMGDGNLVWRLSNRVESRPSCRFALRNEDEVLYVMDQEKVKVLEVGGEWKETAIKLRDYGADEIYVDVSRNGRWLATSTRYGLTIWDLDQRQVAQPGYPSGDFGDVAFHPKEDILACRGADGVDVVSVPDGRRLGRIRLPKPSHHVGLTFNPSGDLLVIEVLGIDVIQGSVEPDLDFYSWVELWDWQWGAQLYRFADAGSAFFNWAGTELVVAGHCLEFWAIPGPKVVTRAEQEWIPEYDSQGNPYRHPNYMDDD